MRLRDSCVYHYENEQLKILVCEADKHALTELYQHQKHNYAIPNLRLLHSNGVYQILRELDPEIERLTIEKDIHGKPFFKEATWHFSVSHSGNLLTAILSKNRPVGVDIQQLDHKVLRVAPKFLTPDEINFINPTLNLLQTTTCWCAKEAIFKLYGKHDISLKKNIHLQPFIFCEQGGSFDATLCTQTELQPIRIKYEMLGNYVLAYTTHTKNL